MRVMSASGSASWNARNPSTISLLTRSAVPASAWASRYRSTSFCNSRAVNPRSNVPGMMLAGNLVAVASLRPDEALSTSIMSSRSRPTASPKAMASLVAIIAVADRKLLMTFIAWPWPGSVPTRKGLPTVSRSGRSLSKASSGPANMMETAPATAPGTPPETGAS